MNNPALLSPSPLQLSQQDIHWANHFIGKSKRTIGAQGCALSCVSMDSAEAGGFKDPAQIAAYAPAFNLNGEILWNKLHEVVPVLTFIWRQYGYDPARIAAFLVKGQKMTQIQVAINAARGEYHWLKVQSIVKTKNGVDYLCNNPYTGMPCYAKATYGAIMGSAHFVKS